MASFCARVLYHSFRLFGSFWLTMLTFLPVHLTPFEDDYIFPQAMACRLPLCEVVGLEIVGSQVASSSSSSSFFFFCVVVVVVVAVVVVVVVAGVVHAVDVVVHISMPFLSQSLAQQAHRLQFLCPCFPCSFLLSSRKRQLPIHPSTSFNFWCDLRDLGQVSFFVQSECVPFLCFPLKSL